MSNQIILRPAASSHRRQPLLLSKPTRTGSTVGEVIGGTTAECVAVCCCCPFGLANFLILAVYKVPAGLCRRMIRQRRRQRLLKEGGLLQPKRRNNCSCGCCDYGTGTRIHPMCANDASDIKRLHSSEPDKDAIALENEMWDRFYSSGFWRSSSRRESSNSNQLIPSNFQLQLVQQLVQPIHQSK